MLQQARSLAPWMVALAVLLAVGVFSAPPSHKKRATLIDRTGPPQPVTSGRRRLNDLQPYYYEYRCVHQGGICRYVQDCPKGQLTSMKGLCPDQQTLGVECCYARPTYAKPIRKSRDSRNSRTSRHHRRYNHKYRQ